MDWQAFGPSHHVRSRTEASGTVTFQFRTDRLPKVSSTMITVIIGYVLLVLGEVLTLLRRQPDVPSFRCQRDSPILR